MHRQLMRLALENAFVDPTKPSPEDALIMSFRKEFGHLYPTPPVVIEHNPIARPYLAMEEIANGQPVKEIEHTIYAKVVSPSELERAASKENQEQWEIRIPKSDQNAGKGSVRVRKTWQDGKEEEASFVQTFKISMNENGDKIEIPMPSNKDMFTAFKFLGGAGMRKVRFVFPIIGTDLKWEIDMFPKPEGGYHEWCKIDLEVRDRSQPIPEFPIALTDVILPEGYGRPQGGNEEGAVRDLYDQFFLLKNEFLQKPSTEPAVGSQQQENGGLNTSEQAALPNDPGSAQPDLGKPSLVKNDSNEPPAQAAGETPAAQSSTAAPDEQPEHEKLNQALTEGTPENLNLPPQSDQGQGQAENPTDDHGNAIPDEPNGAEPNVNGATTPEQAPSNKQDQGLATNPQEGTPEPSNQLDQGDQSVPPDNEQQADPSQPSGDDSVDATGPAEGETGENDESEAEQEIEQNQQQQEDQQKQTLDQTQLKVDQIQKEKQAEAQSQGKPDPTEGGKVPVDLLENPQGDPSVAPEPGSEEAAGEETANGGDSTGATDGTNPDDNAAGTGDGLGGDLAEGAGTTGTDDGMGGGELPETTADGEQGVTGGDQAQAEGANAEGTDNTEVNGEDAATAATPEKATTDELPPENQEQRPKEDEQAQQ
jgi:hypothetical protein